MVTAPTASLMMATLALLCVAEAAVPPETTRYEYTLIYQSPQQLTGTAFSASFFGQTLETCALHCDDEADCKAISFFESANGRCVLWREYSLSQEVDNIGSVSWIKGDLYVPRVATKGEGCTSPNSFPKDAVVCDGDFVCNIDSLAPTAAALTCVELARLGDGCGDTVHCDSSQAVTTTLNGTICVAGLCTAEVQVGDRCGTVDTNQVAPTLGIECPQGTACADVGRIGTDGNAPAVCAEIVAKGGECDPTVNTCGSSSVCREGACIEVAGRGEECFEQLEPKFAVFCQAGLECVPKDDSRFSSGICRLVVPRGAECTVNSPAFSAITCDKGLECLVASPVSGPTTGVCSRFVDRLETCSVEDNIMCRGTLTCKAADDVSGLSYCENIVGQGQACSTPEDDFFAECQSELLCEEGVCKALAAVGESCAGTDVVCRLSADPLLDNSCIDGVCFPLAAQGASCLAGSVGCQEGLECNTDTNTCVTYVGLLEACSEDALCSGQLVCKSGACIRSMSLGEPCNTEAPSSVTAMGCQSGLECAADGLSGRVCKRLVGVGESCELPGSFVDCAPPNTCKDGVCQTLVGLGESCTTTGPADNGDDITCVQGLYCDGQVCKTVVGPGDSCGVASVCRADDTSISPQSVIRCVEGTCRWLAAKGDACDTGIPAGAGSVQCFAGLECFSQQGSVLGLGICHQFAEAGESCDPEDFVRCSGRRTCTGGVCLLVSAPGETCSGEFELCEQGLTCSSGVCKNLKGLGGACTGASTTDPLEIGCLEGLACSDNECKVLAGPGQQCTEPTVTCGDLSCSPDYGCVTVAAEGEVCSGESTVCPAGMRCIIDPEAPLPAAPTFPEAEAATYELVYSDGERFAAGFDQSARLFRLSANSEDELRLFDSCTAECSKDSACQGIFQ